MSESGEGNISRYERHSEFPKIYELKDPYQDIIKTAKFRILKAARTDSYKRGFS